MNDPDLCERIQEFLRARSVCGERGKGDVLLEDALREIYSTRNALKRLARGVDHLSIAERIELGVTDEETYREMMYHDSPTPLMERKSPPR